MIATTPLARIQKRQPPEVHVTPEQFNLLIDSLSKLTVYQGKIYDTTTTPPTVSKTLSRESVQSELTVFWKNLQGKTDPELQRRAPEIQLALALLDHFVNTKSPFKSLRAMSTSIETALAQMNTLSHSLENSGPEHKSELDQSKISDALQSILAQLEDIFSEPNISHDARLSAFAIITATNEHLKNITSQHQLGQALQHLTTYFGALSTLAKLASA